MIFSQSKNRLEAFSDSVFAFAATLLVVSLEVPDSYQELRDQLNGFLSFGISFFALILIWKTHYSFFRRSEKIDNWIIAANMVMLFVILYFVYPLKFLVNLVTEQIPSTLNDLAQLFLWYSLGFTLIFASLSFMYWWSSRINDEDASDKVLLSYFRHFGIFVLVGIVSIFLAGMKIGIPFGLPGLIYFLLGPLCYLHGKKVRARFIRRMSNVMNCNL